MTEDNHCTVCRNLFEYDGYNECYKKYSIQVELGWDEGDWEYEDRCEDMCTVCWEKTKEFHKTLKTKVEAEKDE
jgi:hypothetical protein